LSIAPSDLLLLKSFFVVALYPLSYLLVYQ